MTKGWSKDKRDFIEKNIELAKDKYARRKQKSWQNVQEEVDMAHQH